MEKFTKRDYFNRILSYAHEEDKPFLLHEMELLEKKNASRSTKTTAKQTENIALSEQILNAMVYNTEYTIPDIKALVPSVAEMSPQRVSAILTRLRHDGKVLRSVVKGKTYFSRVLPDED